MSFISYAQEIQNLLQKIIQVPLLHAKWLNTLSYLENAGARKIAACEHPTLVHEEMLKHAAEEFRHAHYLKKQIGKLSVKGLKTYSRNHVLGGMESLHYLSRLDLKTSQMLKSRGHSPDLTKEAAYLLVTYAIERRAEELYPLYEELLRHDQSPVYVKSILLEEKEHLQEMEANLERLPFANDCRETICSIESTLCKNWLERVSSEIERTCSQQRCNR